MKKAYLFFVFVLLLSGQAFANPITKQQAFAEAQNFLQKKGITLLNNNAAYRAPRRAGAEPTKDAYYYVFNAGADNGFVIVSGDDRTMPVLGYADHGTFDMATAPDHVKSWLQGYADEIAYLQKNNIQVKRAPAVDQTGKQDIAPIVKTTWNQRDPYNWLCPVMSNGQRAVTGCVATATAQAMSKFRYPDQTFAQIDGYVTNSLGLQVDPIPANNPLSWADMMPHYVGSETDAQKTAIAQLMFYVGASVKMDYADASGAPLSNVALALREKFGYKSSVRSVIRSNYDLASWTNLIYSELASDRPVIYAGQSTGGGHAFVVDGYKAADGLFHVNWGWGGMSDGYYALTVLEPGGGSGIGASSTSDGYSGSQDAIIGLVPGNSPDEVQVELKTVNENMYYSSPWIMATFWNYSGATQNFDLGYAVWDNGVLSQITEIGSVSINNYSGTGRGVSALSGITAAGTYTIVPVSRLTGTDKWLVNDIPTSCMAEVTVDQYGKVVSWKDLTMKPAISITNVQFVGSKTIKSMQPVKVTLKNDGSEFYGNIMLFANQTDTRGNTISSLTSPTILANDSATIELSFFPDAAGTWNIWIVDDQQNTLKQLSVDIVSTENNSENLTAKLYKLNTALNSHGKLVYLSNTLKATFDVTNGDATKVYQGELTAMLYYNSDGGGTRWSSSALNKKVPVYIGTGQTSKVDVVFDNLTEGNYYEFRLFRAKTTFDGTNYTNTLYEIGKVPFYQVVSTGLTYDEYTAGNAKTTRLVEGPIQINDNATYIDLTNAGTLEGIQPNANPNALYAVASTATVPTNMTNVIKDGVAENITLTDGFDFATPVDFTAQNIEYHRTFTKGSDGNNDAWETVVLPFDVSEVRKAADNSVLTWFTSPDDKIGNFWLRGYTGVNGTALDFVSGEKMEAYKPYIISVPATRWGEKWNLVDREMIFMGSNAAIKSSAAMTTSMGGYDFVGSLVKVVDSPVYVLNDVGTLFQQTTNATSLPFRAYVKANTSNAVMSLPPYLSIGGAPSGISVVNTQKMENGKWYNLYGIEVNGGDLKPGIYLHNGKKVIVK